MLPPIKYKVHPKMAEIQQEKRKAKELLRQAALKQEEELKVLKQQRKIYMEQNKNQISKKIAAIHEKKVIKHNVIKEQQKQRPIRIAIKLSERLMNLIPERRELIQSLKKGYLQNIQSKDVQKQKKIQQIIQTRLIKQQLPVKLQQKIRQNNIIDTNDGICVICLTSEAHMYMTKCRHLISCKDCEFILRLQKKCPLCRTISDYCDLKQKHKGRNKSLHK